MRIQDDQIGLINAPLQDDHKRRFAFWQQAFGDPEPILRKLVEFQIAIPSWALGTGVTLFGRFPGPDEPRSLEEKIDDVGLMHRLSRSCGAISLHIPWDVPSDVPALKARAEFLGVRFDAMNSNTFQDQPDQKFSYKFGSMQHVRKVREQAIRRHNIEVIMHGTALGATTLTVWLSDGSCFPGQLNFRKAFENTLESLHQVYNAMPTDWKMFVEYKAYELNFYSMTVGDWGQSLLYTSKLGPMAFTLVDLGHHLPNANIEQIVSLLLMEGKLGGFHFNDSKYGDDDLTVGTIKPYQLFLIFNELIDGMEQRKMNHARALGWMIDASHNLKDPLEDLLQSVEAILIAYAHALKVDRQLLEETRDSDDVALAQDVLQRAFRTDVRPLVAEARFRAGGVMDPMAAFRILKIRDQLTRERGRKTFTTGL